jgi:hypothetical protein
MKRICPFCKSVLHKNSSFFCSSCGNVLPDELQLKKVSLRNVREMNEAESRLVSLSKSFKGIGKNIFDMVDTKILAIGISLGILIAVCFYLLVRFTLPTFTNLDIDKITNGDEKEESIVVSTTKPSNIISLETGIKSGIFGQNKVTEFVPYDVDLYMEFNDFSTFEPYFNFLGGELFTLSESIKDKVNPFYSAFLVTRDGNKYWTFIIFPLEGDLNAGSYSGLTTDNIENFTVISTNEVVIEEVKATKLGTQKSLALNPSFVLIKNTLPVEGKILITTFNDSGKLELENILAKTTSDDIKLIINKFKELKSNFIVIK